MKSYLAGLSRACFKRDRHGNFVFYPWGVFGRGRILPDQQVERALDGFTRRCYLLAFAVIVSVQLLPDWRWSAGAAVALLLYWFLGLRSRLVGCPYSDERLRLGEARASQAQAIGSVVLWVLFAWSVLLCLAGIYGLLALPSRYAVACWVLIAIFAPSSYLWGRLLWLKRAGRIRKEEAHGIDAP